MKKSHFILSSTVALTLATAGLLALHTDNSTHQTQTTQSSVSSSQTSRQSQSRSSTPSSSEAQTEELRSDLTTKPTEKTVTEELVSQGQELLSNRQVSQYQTQFDFNAMEQGDFSSIAGTWEDANGYTFQFSPTGIVTSNSQLNLSSLSYDDSGEAVSNVYTTNGGAFLLHYYAAGQEIPSWHFGITNLDPSDFGQDRLFATQTNRFDYESTEQFVSTVFYKISNDYPDDQDKQDSQSSQTEQASSTASLTSSGQTDTTPSESSTTDD